MEKSRFSPGALELGMPVKGSYDIDLRGVEELYKRDKELSKFPECPPPEAEFQHMVGIGNRCYYIAQGIINGETTTHERGVGLVKRTPDGIRLERVFPIVWGSEPEEVKPCLEDSNPVKFLECEFVRLQTITPPTYLEALASPYSVITCAQPFNPNPVAVEENSLLGRIGDVIQSVDMDELKEMLKADEIALQSITETQKQIQMKARRLDMDRKNAVISSPILRVAPDYTSSTRPNAQKGSIIFNNDTDSLEYFDGTKWRTLAKVED